MPETVHSNRVELSGEVLAAPSFSHEVMGEAFYTFPMGIKRLSGVSDRVAVLISTRLEDPAGLAPGVQVAVEGEFRSYNNNSGTGSRLILSVFAKKLSVVQEPSPQHRNQAFFTGYLCKPASYRKTPLGREITDLILAVNRLYGKSDYIPCIAWGRNARFAKDLSVGEKIVVTGRLQSREYIKVTPEGDQVRTAYEVSISGIMTESEKEDREEAP